MNISSVVLRARPERLPGVRAGLAGIPGVEIQADANDGRLVLTIEDCAGQAPADAFVQLHQIEGVIGVSLVYQYCDDAITEGNAP